MLNNCDACDWWFKTKYTFSDYFWLVHFHVWWNRVLPVKGSRNSLQTLFLRTSPKRLRNSRQYHARCRRFVYQPVIRWNSLYHFKIALSQNRLLRKQSHVADCHYIIAREWCLRALKSVKKFKTAILRFWYFCPKSYIPNSGYIIFKVIHPTLGI